MRESLAALLDKALIPILVGLVVEYSVIQGMCSSRRRRESPALTERDCQAMIAFVRNTWIEGVLTRFGHLPYVWRRMNGLHR